MNNTTQVSLALAVNVLSYVATKYLNLTIDNATWTTFLETIVLIGTAIWALIAHKKVVNAAIASGVSRGIL